MKEKKKVYYRRRAFLCPPRSEVDSFISAYIVRHWWDDEKPYLDATITFAGCSDRIHWNFSDEAWSKRKAAKARKIINEFFDALDVALADDED